MEKCYNIQERLEKASGEACILSNALEFVKTHADDAISFKGHELTDIMHILQDFSDRLASDLIKIDLDMRYNSKAGEIA